MSEMERNRRPTTTDDEIEETVEPGEERATREDAGEQDFALRGTMMSNAIPGGSAAAGAVIGSGGELGLDPTIDEAELEQREERAKEQHGRE